MKQLSALDTVMLLQGTDDAPNQIGPIFLCDQSTAPGGRVTFKGILADFESRLHLAPAFRRKLVPVPLGLDAAWWVEDDEFDLEFHVRHLALPQPGDWRQLTIQLARLMSRPLDMSRPPWELYVIEGLNDVEGLPQGAYALFFKVHHAIVDGQGGAELFGSLAGLTPDAVVDPPRRRWKGERPPSDLTLLTRALIKQPSRTLDLGKFALRMGIKLPKLAAYVIRNRGIHYTIPPTTRFGGQVDPHRVFEAVRFDLAEVKRIKNSLPGTTVNDVALAIVGGAMRRYLLAHDELPDSAMVAAVPVSKRTTAGQGGNQLDGAMVAMATDLEDDLERLAAISANTENIRNSPGGYEGLAAVSEMIPHSILGLGLRAGTGLPARTGRSLTVNATVTNIAGSPVPYYLFGGRVITTLGLGPILDGIGLCNVIMSYCDDFTISAISCREMMPDPAFYAECLRESFEALSKGTKN